MTYGIENATFVCSMYQASVALKDGETHCPYCRGYAIRPIPRERGENIRGQRHEDCTYCDKKGKVTGAAN